MRGWLSRWSPKPDACRRSKLITAGRPKNWPSLASFEIIGQIRTATEVGGDYYDFIEMADGRICIAVGDATGHGMAAGLVVGMVKMGLINGLQRMNGHASVKL